MREIVRPLLEAAIKDGVAPGFVIQVGDGDHVIWEDAVGTTADPEDGGAPVTVDTVFDIASVTKAVATSTLFMHLVSRSDITLDDLVWPFLPELCTGRGQEYIRLRHLLGHGSGLPAHVHFFDTIGAGNLGGAKDARDALVLMAGREPLLAPPGEMATYSDLGYILLGRLAENLFEEPLEVSFERYVSKPLGMGDTHFRPSGAGPLPSNVRIAPSEKHASEGLLLGVVHDDNCRAGGGVCGHAGLFSTVGDLGRFARALIACRLGRSSYLPTRIVQEFWSNAATESSWRMGWDTPSGSGISHAGDHWPLSGVGHLGFTGSALWLAPLQERYVVLLSNRVYRSWDPPGIRDTRRAVMNAIARHWGWA